MSCSKCGSELRPRLKQAGKYVIMPDSKEFVEDGQMVQVEYFVCAKNHLFARKRELHYD